MSQSDIRHQIAQRKVQEFERKFGHPHLLLAYHAALPVALNSQLLHLLRINFFLDPPESLPYHTEIDLLLSPLCQEVGDDLYEIDSDVRDTLLKGLAHEYGDERIRQIAALLWQYTERFAPWAEQIELERAQQLTALNFLNPEKAKAWLEKSENFASDSISGGRDWFVAMRGEIERLKTNTGHHVKIESPYDPVPLDSKFYVEREDDRKFKHQLDNIGIGTLTTIRAARQTGKTSLLKQGILHACEKGTSIVSLNLQRMDESYLKTANRFCRYLAECIVKEAKLDLDEVEKVWRGPLGPQDKLTRLLARYILPRCGKAGLLLAMDEVDRLLETDFSTDFFALVRSWHNSRAYSFDSPWRKLHLVLVISTEPNLLIADEKQSPFNVGLRLYLEDFTIEQVSYLNEQHLSPLKDNEIPKLMRLLNGHPYLTRLALYTLVKESSSWSELERDALTSKSPFAKHLLHYYHLLRDKEELKTGLREVMKSQRCSDGITRYRLLRAGLVKGDSERCVFRCDLYRQYFEEKLYTTAPKSFVSSLSVALLGWLQDM